MSNPYLLKKVPPTVVKIGGSNNFSAAPNKAGAAVNVGVGGNIFTVNTSSVNMVGINSLGIGGNIFVNNTTGINNIGIGGNIFDSNITGNCNIGVGINSGNSILGSYNTMVGSNTGQQYTDGNIYNNSTALGYGAVVNASNQIVLGTIAESVVIPSITPANNSTSGALVVAGGMGIAGDTYVSGNIITSSISSGNMTVGGITSTAITATSLTAGTLSVGNISSGNMTVGGITSTTITATSLSTGTLSVGNISSGTITAGTLISANINSTTSGTHTVGSIATGNYLTLGAVSTTSIYVPSATISSNTTTGALIVSGGAGIGGNAFIGGSVSPLQYLETVYSVTPSWSGTTGSLTVNYNNGLLYWLTTGTTGTITSLTLNNIPSISGTSLTFAFMLNTTSSVGYISAGSVTVNGISRSMVSSTINGTPSTYILQTIHLFNIGGTINTLITSASIY
jgi:hypothetical protein